MIGTKKRGEQLRIYMGQIIAYSYIHISRYYRCRGVAVSLSAMYFVQWYKTTVHQTKYKDVAYL